MSWTNPNGKVAFCETCQRATDPQHNGFHLCMCDDPEDQVLVF